MAAMTPIEIGQIPWLPQVRGREHEEQQRWLAKADYSALYAVGADSGTLRIGVTKDIRQRASQLRSEPRAPRWLFMCYLTPKLLARRLLAEVTMQLEIVHLGEGWCWTQADDLDDLVVRPAARAKVELLGLRAFIEGAEAAMWNDAMRLSIAMFSDRDRELEAYLKPNEVIT